MSPPTALEVSQQDVRPPAQLRTEEFRVGRPGVVGPETPEAPFPILLVGKVQRGFGRGGKDLGCPTGACLLSCSCPAAILVLSNGVFAVLRS